MSNLSGNYKINAGEVHGVDVVREQERRARLQLLDEIREPSPQPIFGEPVKVELEDETSRRIKNTLGDFTQVLINDSKNLLGISRTSSSTSGHGGSLSGRNPSASKRPPIANGMYKPSTTNIPKHPAPDKRVGVPRNKVHDSISCPPNSLHSDSRLNDQTQWVNHHRKPGAASSLNGSSHSGANPNNPSIFPYSSNLPSNNKAYLHARNSIVSTTGVQAPRFGENSSSAPPPKRCVFRPSTLKLPERRPEKPVESPKRDQDLETILREMKQAVPPPLTAIQTPRTEESGFSFPDDPKAEVLLNTINELKLNTFTVKSPDVVPQPPEPPKSKEANSRQNTPSPLLKKSDSNMPAVLVDNSLNNNLEPGRKEPDIKLGTVREKTNCNAVEPVPKEISSPCLETEKATELLESLLNESDKCISSSLQEDLEMSDSDDEAITDAKSTESKVSGDISTSEFPKSSPINTSVTPINSSTAVSKSNMDVPQSVPSNSSSSESGDSDSDDSSSSESNDSDSSASSDASDADTPSKMWGLSNFFDETRRNHSPAFVPLDTSTNSSIAAVKEELAQRNARENYSLVDDDSVHGSIREPIADPIPNFLELDKSVNIKNEILSPITSPLRLSGPPAPLPPPPPPPPQAIRGPRTPPSPSFPIADESANTNRNSASSGNIQTETSVTAELTVPQSQTKHSVVQQNSCDMREEAGKVQATTVKKRLSKKLSEIFSPRTDSSPVTLSFEDDEPSASKGLPDVSLDKDENAVLTMISSYSVPSETSESSHDNYSIKTRQKVSKSSSAKKSKTPSGESLTESGQKGNNVSKSVAPKFKHPTRTIRASSDSKQLSKTSKSSTKSDQSEEVKKPVKSDQKEKSSSEKNKTITKPSKTLKAPSKNSLKVKKKVPKMPPKQVTDGKKGEVKRKKNKFHIENFLQSPTISQSESDLLSKVSTAKSPSRDRSPIPDFKNSVDNKRRPSMSPSRASRSPSRSSSKSVERAKCNEKLRRSTRCSERASSLAQAESSAVANQTTETAKKSARKTPKRREHADGSPVAMEPLLLLSPIPRISSPIPMTSSECAIPTKIIVSIPLDKLTRLPAAARGLDLEIKPTSKRPQQPADANLQKKESVLLEKSSKNASNKRTVSKDIKDKPRTDVNSKSNKSNKCALVSKKDKNVKALSEPSVPVKSKTSSSVNNKPSIKTPESKHSWDSNESKVSKKRKNEENKQPQKKKIKVCPDANQDKVQHTATRPSSFNNFVTNNAPKELERCDSVSSLSSLGSQISQRSSKEKRSSIISESKKGKSSSVPVKHIKKEIEEKIKSSIKKEPASPEKSKEKSRDKLLSKDDKIIPIEPLWNDASSQFSLWVDPCKEDSKGPLSISTTIMDSINRVCGYEWDSLELKDLKEGSNLKHNNPPIMPMDYYYTEGRKQRHLAEREKDPFLQTLKYFEATVLFILTSQQREEYTKEPESVYQFYRETLNFSKCIYSSIVMQNARREQSSPGSTEFKLLILLLRCQALLHVKLYNLKLKEIKEQQKSVSEFFLQHCQATVRSLTHPTPSNPKFCLLSIPSPVSPTPSPASSVNSQTSGYSSSDVSSCHRNLPPFSPSINVAQSMLEMICRQHTHFINLHMGHDLWEQADMYMTRSNLREFFKEVADQSENLTLHSSIKDLVNYVQTGLSLVKKCSR